MSAYTDELMLASEAILDEIRAMDDQRLKEFTHLMLKPFMVELLRRGQTVSFHTEDFRKYLSAPGIHH